MEKVLYNKFVTFGLLLVVYVYSQSLRYISMASINIPQALASLGVIVGFVLGGLLLIRAYQTALAAGWKQIAEMREARIKELTDEMVQIKHKLADQEIKNTELEGQCKIIEGYNLALQHDNKELRERQDASDKRIAIMENIIRSSGMTITIPGFEPQTQIQSIGGTR